MGEGMKAIVRGLRRHAVVVVGFALFCSLLRQPYFGNVISDQLPEAHIVRAVLDGLILVLATVAIAIGGRANERGWLRSLPLACVALFAFGVGVLAALRASGLGGWLSYVGALFCAAGFVILAFLWMRLLGAIPRDEIVPVAMLSFTVSLLLGFADAAEGLAKDAINMLVPICSVFCAMRVAGKAAQGDVLGKRDPGGSAHILVLVVVAIAVEVLCCSLVRGTWNGGGVGYAGVNRGQLRSYLVSAAVGVAFLVVSAVARRPEKGGVALSVVSLVGIIVLIIVLVTYGRGIAVSFVTSLYSALLVVLFAVLASAALEGALSPLSAAGVFCAVFGAISFVSYTAIPGLAAYDRGGSSEFLLPAALAAALVIVVGEFAIMAVRVRAQVKALKSALGDASREDLWDGIAAQPGVAVAPASAPGEDALAVSVAKAAERYRLTAREADIVRLFAQGYTIKRAAEELCLAPSTVQGYTKSIYAKLGIHGKDEIRDLLADLAR